MADDYPRPDLERMYKMRSSGHSGSGGGGGSSRSGGGCPPALVSILAAPWLLDLLLTASGRLT
jgi:hypothetical protein